MVKNPWNDILKDKKRMVMEYLKTRNINNYNVIYVAISLFLLLWLSTGFFTVDADEEGVVIRFGKYNRRGRPGLNFKLPTPIETVEKVSVTRIKKDIIGKVGSVNNTGNNYDISVRQNNRYSENDINYPKESQMLTGDENIIDMHFYVQWKIGDAKSYLFNIKDSQNENIVKSAAESIMRQIISEVVLSEALSEKRLLIERDVKKGLQTIMNSYNSGIDIISVGILYSYVGPEVRDAYRDVQSAKADRERFINQAQAFRNEIIPKAKGEAATLVEKAFAYKESVVSKAYGDASKFSEIYKSYLVDKDVTKKRMYLDTMEKIYRDTSKIVVDKEVSSNTLSLLSLDKINNK